MHTINRPPPAERSFACRRTIVHRPADDRSLGVGRLIVCMERGNGM
ncbi:hypothetical protein [uncultured Parabacteroides sp.]|nr:hypothetical protein [uncultured Parabacteroides sp.]